MFIYLNRDGTLKEIISEKKFRAGDSKRDKLFVYYEQEKSVSAAWVKFIKANGTQTIETQFYNESTNNFTPKELPTEPIRNLEYFNYDHTFVDASGNHHIGYEFFEITIPDEVLASATSDSKLCSAIIRFVFTDGTEQTLDQAGVIPFSVDGTSQGLVTDTSINDTQYNYLIKLNADVSANPSGLLDDTLTSIRIKGVNYGINGGDPQPDEYLIKATKTSGANFDEVNIEGKNFATTVNTIIKVRPNKYVKETSISGKELSMTNVVNDVETTIAYGAGASELALQSDLNAEIQNRKDADDLKVDKVVNDTTNNSINKVSNEIGNQGVSLTSETVAVGSETAKLIGIATHNAPSSANGLLAEIYGVEKTSKVGTRIIVKENKIYYTKGKNDISVVDNEEIATKADLGGGYEAGDNITFSTGTGTNQKINANQIEDINASVNPLKTYSAKFINELLATKTQKKIDAGGGNYAYVWNESSGGGARFEDTVRRAFSFVGVNADAYDGIGAQIYDIQKDTSGNIESGSWLDIKKDGIYYYSGTYKTPAQRDVNDNKVATIKDISTDFEKKLTAGDNITIDRTNPNAPIVSSNQIDDVNISTSKAYSNSKVNELVNKKTDKEIVGTNGKALIFNETDGGGAKFEGNNNINSYVGVNDGSIKAQIYSHKTDNSKSVFIDVTENKAYYYKGAYVDSATRDVDNNEIAVKGDVATEKTRAETAEGTLTTNLGNEVTRATTKETELEGKFADYNTKTEITTKLADYAKTADVYNKTETYSKTEIDTELGKKANDFDIDTTTLEWDTTATLRKLKAIIPSALHFKDSKDYVSEVLAITTHTDGDLYWAWKDDRTTPQATAPVVNAFIVWSDYKGQWVYAGSSEVDLTPYLKTADAELVYAKIANVYAKTETYNKTEVDTAIANKQDKLENQVNIASIGSSLMSQISLLDNTHILITMDGGDLSVTSDRIDINMNGVNCTFAGGMHSYHQRVNKSTIYPLLLTFTADSGFTLPASVVAELDGTPLVLNTDYTWNQTNGKLQFLQPAIDKGKLASSREFILKVTGE